MTVVAALKLDDAVAAGVTAGKTNRRHAGFRAGGDETNFLHCRKNVRDHFGDFNLSTRGSAERKAAIHCCMNRLNDFRIIVAENHRPPGADIVREALVRHIPHIRALGALDKARSAADRAESSYGGVDAARNDVLGAFDERLIEIHDCLSFGK